MAQNQQPPAAQPQQRPSGRNFKAISRRSCRRRLGPEQLIQQVIADMTQVQRFSRPRKQRRPTAAGGGGQQGDFGLGTGAHGRQWAHLEILSDTQGVDFGPYLQRILQDVRETGTT